MRPARSAREIDRPAGDGGAFWLVGWRAVTRSLGFFSILILAHLLTPADFGVVALATTVTAAIDGLSQLGVRDALVRLKEESRDHYDTAFTFQVLRGLATGLLVAALAPFAGSLFGEPRLGPVLLVLAGSAVVGGCENIGVVRFSRELDFRMQFLLQTAPRVLGFLATTVLAFALRSYWALVWGAAFARLVGVGATYIFSAHRPRFSLRGWRYLLSFSAWTWASGLALIVWMRADPFLLGPVIGSALLGIYVLAFEIATLPTTELIEPASTALFPGLALALRQGSDPVARGLSAAAVLALCTVPLAIGVSACSGFLVTALLGPQWQAAQPLIAIMAFVCIFSSFSYVCTNVLSATCQLRRVFASTTLAAVLKMGAILAVRGTGNLKLIALVSVGVVAMESAILLVQLGALRQVNFRAFAAALVRTSVSGGVMAIALWFGGERWLLAALRPRSLSGAGE